MTSTTPTDNRAEPSTDSAPIAFDYDARPGIFRRIFAKQAFQILLVLIAIFVLFTVLAPTTFATTGNIRLVALNASILAVLAVGMTFVIVTAGIDLSIGSVLVFSGVVAAKTMVALGGQGWGVAAIGVLVSVASGIAWGLVNGFLIAKAKVPPLIVTLGTLGMALGLALVITTGVDVRDVPMELGDNLGYGMLFGTVPMITVVAVVVIALGAITLHMTRFGLHTFAIGSNEEAAKRVGIRVGGHLIAIYAISGGLAGLAGILSLSQFGTTAISGQSATNLAVIAAVVIGGTSLFGGVGTILGTVVGLFIPAVLQNGFVIIGIQPFWQQVAVGAVLILAVYVDQARRAAAARGSRPHFFRRSVGLGKKTNPIPDSAPHTTRKSVHEE